MYYKIRQLLQNTTFITNCDSFITKYDSYYKMGRLLQIVRVLLQNATVLTNCDSALNITLTWKPVYHNNKDFVMKFSIMEFLAHLVTFTSEILNGKFHF